MLAKILLILFALSFLIRIDHSFDQDLGRHLKLGEIIWQTKSVPKTNLFSYTNPNFPFINTHWLFEVAAYFFSLTVGLRAFLILKIVALLLSVFLVLGVIPKKNQVLLLPLGYIFLHALRERLDLRPEIFSFLFTALTLFILNGFLQAKIKAWGSNKLIWLLPIIQLIWINTHIYFFVGLTLQAIFLLYLIYQYLRFRSSDFRLKLLAFVFILSVLASLINPNGLSGFLYPLNVNQNYGYTIVENQTMFLLERINFTDINFLWVKISVFLITISLILSLINKRLNILYFLVAVFGMALALLNVRSFPYLIFLSLPATLINFGETKKNALTSFLAIVSCILIILEGYFYLNGDYYKYKDYQNRSGFSFLESAKGALDFALNKNLPGPVYNNFDIGSYLIYRGYPKYRVFVDGRPEAYPKEFFSDIYIPSQSDFNRFKDLGKKYHFQTIIFSHTDQTPWGKNFLQNIVKDKDWKLVYIDDFMIVLVKDKVALEKNIKIVDLATLSPNRYSFDSYFSYLKMGVFLLSAGYPESGSQFIKKASDLFPQSPIINQLIGGINQPKSYFFW